MPGGGIALVRTATAVDKLIQEVDGDIRTGARIVRKALEEPVRQIANNAGEEGSVVVEKVMSLEGAMGFDAYKGEYVDMIKAGILDPTKVVRSALQNAASVAAMVLTTESLVADIPEKKNDMPPGGMGGMDMM